MLDISSHAIISPKAVFGENVTIGHFCIIEDDVHIGDNTIIYPYVHIKGSVNIGRDNQIFNNVTIGQAPQDLSNKFSKENDIIIGDNNIIREGVTINAPVLYETHTISANTRIGNNCLLMSNSHVSHNTVLHDNVIFANNVLPAGCCIFDNNVFISGNVIIHQNVHIGANVMISGGSRIGRDIPPFMLVSSFYGLISGINSIGLRRSGFSVQEREIIKDIFKIFKTFNALNPARDAILQKYQDSDSVVVKITLEFLKTCRRGISEFGDGSQAKKSII